MRAIRLTIVIMLGLAAAFSGCGQRESSDQPAVTGNSDRDQMQVTLNEVVARWHNGDKAVLYDNEFDYVRDRISFDDYLKRAELKLDADTVKAMNVQSVEMLGQDSAKAKVEVVFEGPTGKISKRVDSYFFYHYRGRWIRPTISGMAAQREWDSLRTAADSAAEAEAKDLGDK